jgi:HPt (histidine-containing phosphotransfer) domain-containing protein
MSDWLRLQARLPLLDEHQLGRLERELGAETLLRLLALFVEDAREQERALEQAFEARDHGAMARHCHSLKSACGSYGALRCQFLGEKLELSCRERNEARVAEQMGAWRQALEATLDELAARLGD